jgi:hypothetical protein
MTSDSVSLSVRDMKLASIIAGDRGNLTRIFHCDSCNNRDYVTLIDD